MNTINSPDISNYLQQLIVTSQPPYTLIPTLYTPTPYIETETQIQPDIETTIQQTDIEIQPDIETTIQQTDIEIPTPYIETPYIETPTLYIETSTLYTPTPYIETSTLYTPTPTPYIETSTLYTPTPTPYIETSTLYTETPMPYIVPTIQPTDIVTTTQLYIATTTQPLLIDNNPFYIKYPILLINIFKKNINIIVYLIIFIIISLISYRLFRFMI